MARLLLVATVALCVVGSGTASGNASAKRCAASQLRVSVATKGLSGTTWIGVTVRNTGGRCTLGGSVSYLIERGGFRAAVRGNPLKIPLKGAIGHARSKLVKAVWSNWCGRRIHFKLTVGYAGKTRHSGFAALPRCLDRTSPSQIVKIF